MTSIEKTKEVETETVRRVAIAPILLIQDSSMEGGWELRFQVPALAVGRIVVVPVIVVAPTSDLDSDALREVIALAGKREGKDPELERARLRVSDQLLSTVVIKSHRAVLDEMAKSNP